MMRYYKIISDGYITAIGTGNGNAEITETEYSAILDTIHNKPEPGEGFDYRLKADMTWEQFEVPRVEVKEWSEEQLQAMTNAELQAILAGMGISASMTKANMVQLILSYQEETLG